MHLEKEAQQEEEKCVLSTDRDKQRILQEKQSKLSAIIDATALNDEHKQQVSSIFLSSYVHSLMFSFFSAP